MLHDETSAPLTEAERNALRAFLGRAEVRMSTLHRIAVSFVGGAGLLLLIPIFLRDVVDGVLMILLESFMAQAQATSVSIGWILTITMVAMIVYPFVLSLSIPLYGVYLLLKDVIHFYFTIYMPGFPSSLLNPTFSLYGLTFSPDESPRVKEAMQRYQYSEHNMDYMMPFSKRRRELYFDMINHTTDGEIVPASRRLEAIQHLIPPDADPREVQRMNTAFGIARSLDRTLIEEAAVTEMAVARNILYLRRLVLRYVKTLVMFIWTTLISFVALPFLENSRFPTFVMMSLFYMIWSLGVMRLIRMPLTWIYRHRYGDTNRDHIDAQLTFLERRVEPFCRVSVVSSVLALLLSVIVLFI